MYFEKGKSFIFKNMWVGRLSVDRGGQLEGSGSVQRDADGLHTSTDGEVREKGMNSRDIDQEKLPGFGGRLGME